MTDATQHYLTTALWSSTNSESVELDSIYGPSDIDKASLVAAEATVATFLDKCSHWLVGVDDGQAVHDLWLTRNGHGAGFWDGDYETFCAEKLCEYAESIGECYISEDPDGTFAIVGEA